MNKSNLRIFYYSEGRNNISFKKPSSYIINENLFKTFRYFDKHLRILQL